MKIKPVRKMTISAKLMLVGVICILGIFLLSTESVSTAWQINEAGKELSDDWMNAIILAEELNTATSDYRIKESHHGIATDQKLMDSLEGQMDTLQLGIQEKFAAYKMLNTHEEDQALIRQAEQIWNAYIEHSKAFLEISRGNNREEATRLLMGESEDMFNEASGKFLEAVECTKEETAKVRRQADDLYLRLSHLKLLMIVVVSALVISLVMSLLRSIRVPCQRMVGAARRATNGNLDISLNYRSQDEIGVLAEAMNELIQRLKNIIGDETRILREIGGGNLNARSECEQAYRGDFAPILYAFTGLESRLKAMNQDHEEEISRLQAEIEELEKRIDEYEQK